MADRTLITKSLIVAALLLSAFSSEGVSMQEPKAAAMVRARIPQKKAELYHCLVNWYGLDEQATYKVLEKFDPLFANGDPHRLVNQFLEKSYEQNIPRFRNEYLSILNPSDAVLVAPQWHEVLADTDSVRVLWVTSKSGDFETPHTHQWRGLMVIFQSPKFAVYDETGKLVEEFDSPAGVYELSPEHKKLGYLNQGPGDFEALNFEIKHDIL